MRKSKQKKLIKEISQLDLVLLRLIARPSKEEINVGKLLKRISDLQYQLAGFDKGK